MDKEFRRETASRLRHLVQAVATNRREAVRLVPEGLASCFEHPVDHDVDDLWELRFHQWLDVPWPCSERQAGQEVWNAVVREVHDRGPAFGRHTYVQYSDGDAALGRALWCTVRHTRPAVVVETGVPRGVTSRIVLEALEHNGEGHLWGVDLPHLFEPDLRAQISEPRRASRYPPTGGPDGRTRGIQQTTAAGPAARARPGRPVRARQPAHRPGTPGSRWNGWAGCSPPGA
ncbi:hypothetical protein [Streptomyces ossamyceticus]|uniref:hypothetical protein n=1 Tax=Streptomyces ossamyceticus TaxID=249581 RepID=UPI0006E3321F|nr:hypothetical protein [Streptomyces ossamyceticus]